MDNERTERPQKPKGFSPTALAFGLVVLVGLVAAGLVFATMNRGGGNAGQKGAEEATPAEVVDPFAGLPEEEPPAPRDESRKRVDRLSAGK